MRKPKTLIKAAAALFVVFLLGFATGQGRWLSVPRADAQKKARTKVDLPDFSGLSSELKPSVVYVVVSGTDEEGRNGLPKDHPKVPPDSKKGVGSGFVIDSDGLILTNDHVVEGADKLEVAVAGGKRHKARLIGRDPQLDIALIKVTTGDKLKTMRFGDSDRVRTGQWVVALGNPFGLENNVTVGVVTGKGRELPEAPFVDFIQTDAAIYPGNSGGPLVDLQGEVVGINTAVVPGTQLGFSIPINKVKEVLPELKEGGRVRRGFIGIGMSPVSQAPAPAADEKGVLVSNVGKDGPAEKAGVRQGDVITAFSGRKVDSPNDLAELVSEARPGRVVKLTLERDKQKLTFDLTVGQTPKGR